MTIATRIDADLASAMRSRDRARLSAVRLLKTALTNKAVERGRALSDAEAAHVVRALAKQRQDSIDQFDRAGRADLVEQEKAELSILESYLPPAMDADALSAVVDAAIADVGATGEKDFGRAMKAAMARLSGEAVDGRQVSDLVKARLPRA